MLAAQHTLLRVLGVTLRRDVDFAKRHATVPPQKIDRGVGGDARQPVRRLLFVLELVLALQRFDEGFLRQILRVGHIAHNAVNLHENPAQVLGDKAVLPLERFHRRLHCVAHQVAIQRFHGL